MPVDIDDIADHVDRVSSSVRTVQLDIMDGVFVPGKTWPFMHREDMNFVDQDFALPRWQDIDYELDIMVDNPEQYRDMWVYMGPCRIVFHYESLRDPLGFLASFADVREHIEIGIAISLDTDPQVLEPLIPYVDRIQFMGIAKIGVQGEPFDTRVLEQISYVRAHFPNITISVDGAMNEKTVPLVAQRGVHDVVVGSFIFKQGIPQENIKKLKSLLQ